MVQRVSQDEGRVVEALVRTEAISMVTRRPRAVNADEYRLAYSIIAVDDTLYCLNIFDCQLEEKESHTMYAVIRMMPSSSVSLTGASFVSYSLKIAAPPVTATAMPYSNAECTRRDTT